MNADKEHAKQLLNRLQPDQIAAVVHLMSVMLDPLSVKLAGAPLEDEEISEEEERAVEEALEWRKHNEPISHEEVLAHFGLSMTDFDRMSQIPLSNKPNGSERSRRR